MAKFQVLLTVECTVEIEAANQRNAEIAAEEMAANMGYSSPEKLASYVIETQDVTVYEVSEIE